MGKRKRKIAIMICVMLICSTLFSSASIFAETGDEKEATTVAKSTEPEAGEGQSPSADQGTSGNQDQDKPEQSEPEKTPDSDSGNSVTGPENSGSGEVIKPEAGGQTSGKIDDYLDADGTNLSTSNGGVYDPSDTMNLNGSFTVNLKFSEKTGGIQFPVDGKMTYQIPGTIKGFTAVPETNIYKYNTEEIIGTYTIQEGGEITVMMDPKFFNDYSDSTVTLSFKGSFNRTPGDGGNQIEIKFTEEITIIVTLTDNSELTIEKTAVKPNNASSVYDGENNLIEYKVKVSTKYESKNVVITDEMKEYLELDKGTPITVTDSSKKSVTPDSIDFTSGSAWKIDIAKMAAGEEYTITYKAKLTADALEGLHKNQDPYKVTVKNIASAKSENSEEVRAECSTNIDLNKIVKKSVKAVGDKVVWAITINTDKVLDLSGYTLVDTLGSGLKLSTTDPMEITKDGVPIKDVAWDKGDLKVEDQGQKWSYVFPNTAGHSEYTFVYKTNKPEVPSGDPGKAYGNNVTLEKGTEKYKGWATYYAPGVAYQKVGYYYRYNDKPKHGNMVVHDESGDTYIRWTHEIKVPAGGLSNVILKDSISTDPTFKSHILPELKGFRTGVPGKDDDRDLLIVDTVVDTVTENNQHRDITLMDIKLEQDNAGKGSYTMTFPSLPKYEEPYKVLVSGFTKVTDDTNGTCRNEGSLNINNKYSYADHEDKGMPMKLTGDKSGEYDPVTKTIEWKVTINTNLANLRGGIKIEDTFSENQTYVGDSAQLSDKQVPGVEGLNNKYTFTIPTPPTDNTAYQLTYKTKVNESEFLEPGVKEFTNKATVVVRGEDKLSLEGKVSFTNNMINKKLIESPSEKNRYTAGFQIVLNPDGKWLIPGSQENPSEYEVIDVCDDTMELNRETIKIFKDASTEPMGGGYTVKDGDVQNGKRTTIIIIDEADGHKYRITYDATIKGKVNDTVSYTNTAILKVSGIKDDSGVEGSVQLEQTTNGGGTGSRKAIYVEKVDAANVLGKKLNGAVFELYKENGDERDLLGTQTTDENGKVTFGETSGVDNNLTFKGEPYYLMPGVKYILIESKAPEGYEKNNTETVFKINGKSDGTLSDVYGYDKEHTFTISNQKYNFYIDKVTETGTALGGAQFTLYKNEACTEKVTGGTVEGDVNGRFTFKNLTADRTYYLKETVVPEGYVDEGKVYKIEIDKSGDLVSAILDGALVPLKDKTLEIKNYKDKGDFGQITVTKKVKRDGAFVSSNDTYYTALFSDSKLTNKVSDVKPLQMNGKDTATVTFDQLELGATYYVAETDNTGKALSENNNQLGASITYDNQIIKLDKTNVSGNATITNSYTTTPSNPLGSIKVTKEVKQDGAALATDNTYYVALFNSSSLTTKVGAVKALEMKGMEMTSVTFDSLPVNTTYYVAETDANGTPLPNQDNSIGATITYNNQVVTLDGNHLTANTTITNSYVSEYYWAGSIDITKRVTVSGKDTETDYVFYAGVYTDKACTQRVGDIQPILMNGKATATVSFPDLPLGTYYVAETDAKGNVITDAKEQLGCDLTIKNSQITLTQENQTGSAELVNNYDDTEDFYYDGMLTVNKTTTYNGKAYNTDDVYYVALFADKDYSERITDVQSLEMNGSNATSVSFENLAYGTYYLAETDEDGNALTDMDAADRGFTSVVNQTVEVGDEPTSIDLENQLTEEHVTNNGNDDNNGNATGTNKGTATQTGDSTNMTPVAICMIMALIVMSLIVIRRRKESGK